MAVLSIDVTMPNRPSRTWVRSSVDSAPGAVAWLPATTTDQRLIPIAQRSRVRCIQAPLSRLPDDATVPAVAQLQSIYRAGVAAGSPVSLMETSDRPINRMATAAAAASTTIGTSASEKLPVASLMKPIA